MRSKKAFHCEIGSRIAKLRIAKKYTREKLAEIVDISDRFLYDIESGRKGCSAEILLRLSRALGVSSDYLMTGGDPCAGRHISMMQMISELPPDSLPYLEEIVRSFCSYAGYKGLPQENPSREKG